MTDSMIERVARALCRCRASQPDYVLGWSSVDQEVHYCWNEWVEEARAAIEAMRTPTEAMVKEGLEEGRWEISLGVGGEHAVMFESAPRTMWEAMIDRALKP